MLASLASRSSVRRGFGLAAWLLVGSFAVRAQAPPPERASAPTILAGRVLEAGGSPAVAAVVVSSAGGRAVSDAHGDFRLAIELPDEAETVRVSAWSGSGSDLRAASATVSGLVHGGTTPVPTLVLAQTSDCDPSWLPTFGEQPGAGGSVEALAVFDDGGGDGPALYVGGFLDGPGGTGTTHVARWDGTHWSAVGGGCDGEVLALAVFDDGNGPTLFAAGEFHHAGGVLAPHIARWDGASWSGLGPGLDDPVRDLAVYDDGDGPALFAGGVFLHAGALSVRRIARWDGTSWSALGDGITGDVWCLATHDDGAGPRLFVGGQFTRAGSVETLSIASWDGASWAAVGGGLDDPGPLAIPDCYDLCVWDDGGGAVLCATGRFDGAGGVPAQNIAIWDGASWSACGSGLDDFGTSLGTFDDGSGTALYAGGAFLTAGGVPAGHVAKWDGASWSALSGGVFGLLVTALEPWDDGSGERLFVGGVIDGAGGTDGSGLVRWDGSEWSALGQGLSDPVTSVVGFDDGGGTALYAGGDFTSAGDGVTLSRIGKWDGSAWTPLGSGLSSTARALAVFDDRLGGGPALYAGGSFTVAGGVPASRIARWDGVGWSPLGVGTSGAVWDLIAHDDGGGAGTALYACGSFVSAGGVTVNRVARWDGSTWSALGGGLNGLAEDLAVFDDGGGPKLYACGSFTQADGLPANRIARWDGVAWSPLGAGLNGTVHALAAAHESGIERLFAGGEFTTAGGLPASRLARWDGTGWTPLGTGANDTVTALLEDGGTLLVGGEFTAIGGLAAKAIARWDGASWSPLGSGVNDYVYDLAVVDVGGGGSALYAGGSFTSALDSGDSYLARWQGCTPPSPWINLGFALPGTAGAPQLVASGTLEAGSPGTLVLSQARPTSISVLFLSLASNPLPFKCGTLATLPVALQVTLFTSPAGTIPLAWPAWSGALSGLSVHFQYAIQDPAAVCGVALSNAVRGDVP